MQKKDCASFFYRGKRYKEKSQGGNEAVAVFLDHKRVARKDIEVTSIKKRRRQYDHIPLRLNSKINDLGES